MVLRQLLLIKEKQGISMQKNKESDYFRYEMGINGWTVLNWLKRTKYNIPVHVMSGMNREKLAKEMGAFDF
jgi:hypothetical protein